MLTTGTVTFWRWLTRKPVSLILTPSTENSVDERRVWLRYAASLNVRCGVEARKSPFEVMFFVSGCHWAEYGIVAARGWCS